MEALEREAVEALRVALRKITNRYTRGNIAKALALELLPKVEKALQPEIRESWARRCFGQMGYAGVGEALRRWPRWLVCGVCAARVLLPYRHGGQKQKYCAPACAKKALRSQQRAARNSDKNLDNPPCRVCGVEIERGDRQPRAYCSTRCRVKAGMARAAAKHRDNPNRAKEFFCGLCGQLGASTNRARRWCSDVCREEGRAVVRGVRSRERALQRVIAALRKEMGEHGLDPGFTVAAPLGVGVGALGRDGNLKRVPGR